MKDIQNYNNLVVGIYFSQGSLELDNLTHRVALYRMQVPTVILSTYFLSSGPKWMIRLLPSPLPSGQLE